MISEIDQNIQHPAEMIPFNSGDPTFIIDMDNKKICKANDVAIAGYNNQNPSGKKADDIIHVEKNASNNITPAYFNEDWYMLKQETILWEGSEHIKVRLEQRDGVPGFDVMKSLKNMIGFLLHRVRSPLTGIQGYAELLDSNTDLGDNQKYLEKINSGIEELFDLLDELHVLQKISLKKVDLNNFSANPAEIISEIIAQYPKEVQDNISFRKEETLPLACNPGNMKRILSLLIENAVEYAPIEDHPVIISQPSANSIKITHSGNPIPQSIAEQLFYPFVTTKARNLGIGLTLAILYAKRYNGSIFLTDNNPFREVSFLLCLPPAQKFQSGSLL